MWCFYQSPTRVLYTVPLIFPTPTQALYTVPLIFQLLPGNNIAVLPLAKRESLLSDNVAEGV